MFVILCMHMQMSNKFRRISRWYSWGSCCDASCRPSEYWHTTTREYLFSLLYLNNKYLLVRLIRVPLRYRAKCTQDTKHTAPATMWRDVRVIGSRTARDQKWRVPMMIGAKWAVRSAIYSWGLGLSVFERLFSAGCSWLRYAMAQDAGETAGV